MRGAIIVLAIFGFFGFYFGYLSFASHRNWAQDNTATGAAWAQNVGKIWFSCRAFADSQGRGTCVNKDTESELTGDEIIGFHVDVSSATDSFSGWAWSNIGWITFDKLYTGDPYVGYTRDILAFATSTDPRYHLGSLLSPAITIRGWAQARSGSIDPLPIEPPPDWTGWIALNCKDLEEIPGETRTCLDGNDPAFNAVNNIVDFKVTWTSTTKELAGWAWGDEIVGWISFNCEDYQNLPGETRRCVAKAPDDPTLNPATELADYAAILKINQPPAAKNLAVQGMYADANNDCLAPPYHRFTWTFSDADEISQTAYDIQISPRSDFSILAASDSQTTTVTIKTSDVTYPAGANELAYNTAYYWRVRVHDSGRVLDSAGDGSKNSGWVEGEPFTTAKHLYPTAGFTFTPKKPSQGEEIKFRESATCYESRDTNGDGVPEPNARGVCPKPAQGDQAAVACPLGESDQCYVWDFDYPASPFTADAYGRTATNVYNDILAHTVAFQITDTDGYTCITEVDQQQVVKSQLPLPKFRETAPSGLEKLQDFTASIMDKSALDAKSIIFK